MDRESKTAASAGADGAVLSVLVVEDDAAVRRLIATALAMHGYHVEVAATGEAAILEAASHGPDLVLLDLGLPDVDGIAVIKKLRSWSNVPIIVISARIEEADKIEALDTGADDYLTKPFSLEELQARILAVLRRTAGRRDVESVRLTNGPLVMEPAKRICRFEDADVKLTDTEYRLLQRLMEKPGHLRTHEELLRAVWGPEALDDLPLLRVTLTRIRKKLQAAGAVGPVIASYSGVGYLLDDYSDL